MDSPGTIGRSSEGPLSVCWRSRAAGLEGTDNWHTPSDGWHTCSEVYQQFSSTVSTNHVLRGLVDTTCTLQLLLWTKKITRPNLGYTAMVGMPPANFTRAKLSESVLRPYSWLLLIEADILYLCKSLAENSARFCLPLGRVGRPRTRAGTKFDGWDNAPPRRLAWCRHHLNLRHSRSHACMNADHAHPRFASCPASVADAC